MTGKLKFLHVLIVFLFFQMSVIFSATSIETTVNRNSLTTNDTLEFKVIISDASGDVQFDERVLSGFDIIRRSSSQNFQFINNAFMSSQIKSYILRPKKTGEIIIPSVTLSIEGKTLSTSPIKINVTNATVSSSQPPTQQQQQQQQQHSKARQTQSRQTQLKDVFVKASVNKPTAYVGEQIQYKLLLFRRVSLLSDLTYELPDFGNMLSEPLTRDENTYTQRIQGARYYVSEIEKRSLFAYEPGISTITPSIAETRLSLFMGNQQLKSNEVSIDIKPLPLENQPDDFSGLVGNFKLETSVDTNSVVENTPIAIRISLSGSGNLKQVTQLFYDESDDYKVYQSNINDQITYTDEVKGVRHFEYIVVPKRAGNLVLPIFHLSTFSSENQTYTTLHTPEFIIDVISSGDRPADTFESKEIQVITEDLRYIKPLSMTPKQATPYYLQPFAWLLLLFNTGWIAYLIGTYLHKKGLFRTLSSYFQPNAGKKALHSLNQIQHNKNGTLPSTQIQQILLTYLSSVLNEPAQGLSKPQFSASLQHVGFHQSHIDSIFNLLDRCSFIAYAPQESSETDEKKLLSDAKNLIKTLQTEKLK